MGIRAFEVEEEEGPEGNSNDVAEGGGRKAVEVLGEGRGEREDIRRRVSLVEGCRGLRKKEERIKLKGSNCEIPSSLSTAIIQPSSTFLSFSMSITSISGIPFVNAIKVPPSFLPSVTNAQELAAIFPFKFSTSSGTVSDI